MSEMTTVGLDQAKNVFQIHGADASGRAELRKTLRRDQVLAFFSQLQPSWRHCQEDFLEAGRGGN